MAIAAFQFQPPAAAAPTQIEKQQVIAAQQQLGVRDDGLYAIGHCQWAICTFIFLKQLDVFHDEGLAVEAEGCLLIHFCDKHQRR